MQGTLKNKLANRPKRAKLIYLADYRNWLLWLFAFIGVLSLAGLITLGWMFRTLDRQAPRLYWNMAQSLLKHGDVATATTWKVRVSDDVSYEDVDESIQTVSGELNIKSVGHLKLGDQVAAMTGKPWRKLKIYQFCQPLTAKSIVDYSDAFAAYFPCRLSLVEDKKGTLWLYTQNMDMMIHGGKPLPPALLKEVTRVKNVMVEIMNRAAKGDF